jgi:hypothetical protein
MGRFILGGIGELPGTEKFILLRHFYSGNPEYPKSRAGLNRAN